LFGRTSAVEGATLAAAAPSAVGDSAAEALPAAEPTAPLLIVDTAGSKGRISVLECSIDASQPGSTGAVKIPSSYESSGT